MPTTTTTVLVPLPNSTKSLLYETAAKLLYPFIINLHSNVENRKLIVGSLAAANIEFKQLLPFLPTEAGTKLFDIFYEWTSNEEWRLPKS